MVLKEWRIKRKWEGKMPINKIHNDITTVCAGVKDNKLTIVLEEDNCFYIYSGKLLSRFCFF